VAIGATLIEVSGVAGGVLRQAAELVQLRPRPSTWWRSAPR